MGNEMFQARIPDEFADRLHEYREERHMSKSEAVRDLLRSGLEAEGHGATATDGDGAEDDLETIALKQDINEVRDEVERSRTGMLVAVVYLAIVVLTPRDPRTSLGLTTVGLLLGAGLWYAGMLDVPTLRGDTDD